AEARVRMEPHVLTREAHHRNVESAHVLQVDRPQPAIRAEGISRRERGLCEERLAAGYVEAAVLSGDHPFDTGERHLLQGSGGVGDSHSARLDAPEPGISELVPLCGTDAWKRHRDGCRNRQGTADSHNIPRQLSSGPCVWLLQSDDKLAEQSRSLGRAARFPDVLTQTSGRARDQAHTLPTVERISE